MPLHQQAITTLRHQTEVVMNEVVNEAVHIMVINEVMKEVVNEATIINHHEVVKEVEDEARLEKEDKILNKI
jgi:hypothetical protein